MLSGWLAWDAGDMRKVLLDHLACPACGGESLTLEASKQDGTEVEEGRILCAGCPTVYPVVRGVPRMLPEAGRYFGGVAPGNEDALAKAMRLTVEHYSSYQGKVSAVFSDTMDHRSIFEARTGLPVETCKGKICLDAGCGNGRNSRLMGDAGAEAVVGLDAGFAVDEAYRRAKGRENVHFVQGDILRPPFRRTHFDFAISMGVLHHTVSPDDAFRSVSGLMADDGIFSVYLYGRPALDWRRFGSAASLLGQLRYALYTEPLRKLVVRLPDGARYRFCQLMWQRRRLIDAVAKLGAPGRVLSRLLYAITPADVHMPLESGKANISRMYDMYSTPYNYSHEVEEVIEWFLTTEAYTELLLTPYRVCVTGWRGHPEPGEPVPVRYQRAASIEAISARGREEGDA